MIFIVMDMFYQKNGVRERNNRRDQNLKLYQEQQPLKKVSFSSFKGKKYRI